MGDDNKFRERIERLRRLKEEKELRQQQLLTVTKPAVSTGLSFRLKKDSSRASGPVVVRRQALDDSDVINKDSESVELRKPAFMDLEGDVADNNGAMVDGDDDDGADPLERFMETVSHEVETIRMKTDISQMEQPLTIADDDRVDEEAQTAETAEEAVALPLIGNKRRGRDIELVDHADIVYEPFRKDFYVESPDIAKMSKEAVQQLRQELDGIKCRGVNCPKPIMKWTQCGLPVQCAHVIRQLAFEKPTPIQCQAIPAIMSGRDVIGIAKTGSGKTMAFLLPMFRHIKDQRPIASSDGPIALVIAPTRELSVQIYTECKRFTDIMGLRSCCAYGGAPIKEQIADLKRGTDILVCTPGRLIDVLSANNGKVTNLRRVTYFVLDECDRLFDFGFELQVMRVVANLCPDAQRILFSATFPRPVEALARKILTRPLEISVGGRSVVCDEVEQLVEVMNESEKFVRLLEIMGEWISQTEARDQRMLIFVDRQESAADLSKKLQKRGYNCLSLHGGMDQIHRDITLHDFKTGNVCSLVATSVAARGLDVPQLNVVVNYDCPNHKEDYVHRVGRTGRAGRKGRAYTFVSPEQEKFAPGIYFALKESKANIPEEFKTLVDDFLERVKKGEAFLPTGGFGGKGLERLEKEREAQKLAQKRSYADVEDLSDEEDDDQGRKKTENAEDSDAKHVDKPVDYDESASIEPVKPVSKAQEIAAKINAAAASRAKTGSAVSLESKTSHRVKNINHERSLLHTAEIEINDYPQKVRRKVSSVEFKNTITEMTRCSLTSRGEYVPPGKTLADGKRKLYLIIEGKDISNVEKAKAEVKRILIEGSNEGSLSSNGPKGGRYSVI